MIRLTVMRQALAVALVLAVAGATTGSHAQVAASAPAASAKSSDATEKDKLEVEKLRLENDKLSADIRNSARGLNLDGILNFLHEQGALILAILAGGTGLWRYLLERKKERLQAEDQRFEKAVAAMGSEHPYERASATVLLATFLGQGYERFYTQVFSLVSSNLRMGGRRHVGAAGGSEVVIDRQGLAMLLRDAYALARDRHRSTKDANAQFDAHATLNAAEVDLDGSYLASSDFSEAWFRGASFRYTSLKGANMKKANLERCDFHGANVSEAIFDGANMMNATFAEASLRQSEFREVRADNAKFVDANLSDAIFHDCELDGADFAGSDLRNAAFRHSRFEGTTIERAESLRGARLIGVTGLSPQQVKACRQGGAEVQVLDEVISIAYDPLD